jgi:hypothetical protein
LPPSPLLVDQPAPSRRIAISAGKPMMIASAIQTRSWPKFTVYPIPMRFSTKIAGSLGLT